MTERVTKKLWTGSVSIDFEMAIWAETKEEALKLAKDNALDEFETLHDGFDVSVSDSPPGGDLDDAIPWGIFDGEKERTVAQLKSELGIVGTRIERLRKLEEEIKARAEVCG